MVRTRCRFSITHLLLVVFVLFPLLVAAAETEKEIKVNLWSYNYTASMTKSPDNPFPREATKVLIQAWTKKHPGVKVTQVEIPPALAEDDALYLSWVATQSAGGTIPDVIYTAPAFAVETLGAKGLILDLNRYLNQANPYVSGNKKWRDLFYAPLIDPMTGYEGESFGVPLDGIVDVLYYNKDVFKKFALTPPETYAELMVVTKKLLAAGYGSPYGTRLALAAGALGQSLLLPWLDDLDVIRKDGFVDPKELARGVVKGIVDPYDPRYGEALAILKEERKYYPRGWGVGGVNEPQPRQLFIQGKTPMTAFALWWWSSANADPLREFQMGIVPYPKITTATSAFASGQPIVSGRAGVALAVTSAATNRGNADIAADFLAFLTAPSNLEKLVNEVPNLLPAVKGAKISPAIVPDTSTANKMLYALGVGGGPSGLYSLSMVPNLTQESVDNTWRYLTLYLKDAISLQEFLAKVSEEWKTAADSMITREGWTF